jgi:hypothetical protein
MYKRPIHCTDPKREVLFVKDDDKWDKDQDKQKIKKAITKVAQNSCKALCDYIKPNMMDANHPDFDKNITLMRNVNGGGNNTNQDKIISIISKNVTVEKMEE